MTPRRRSRVNCRACAAGIGSTLRIGLAAAIITAVIGVAAYLQKSPLPNDP